MRRTNKATRLSDLGGYSGHAGLVTAVLVTLAAATWLVATTGNTVVAAAFYALALAVATPLLADEIKALVDWLF
ncbi:hypothetical protein [Halorientalis litorea]|jgi:hypothetical protein|uniref:hypothetical protein n=1 Tax=Halorientalis litorea TaxID=2931977 RepID=UPI001FF16C40|nr:hypothetical protein [Halorientalis litorea]